MLGSKDIYTVNKWDIYEMNEDLCLTEKDQEKLLQSIHWTNGLKVWVGINEANDRKVTVTNEEHTIKNALKKGLECFGFLILQTSCLSLWTQRRFDCKDWLDWKSGFV